ncbi:MAG TPA: vanomycin resistance protein VanB [Clostridiaceae bacterium]|nr:vanomycin resistance protein VanB [Clostridiaceae bacterium]
MLLVLIKKYIWILLPILIVLIIVAAAAVYISTVLGRETIYDGVFIENVNVSGLTTEQAKAAVKQKLNRDLENVNIELFYGDLRQKIDLKSLSYVFETGDAVKKAYSIGRKGSIFARMKEIMNVRKNNVNISVASGYDKKKLRALLEEIKKKIDTSERNASTTFEDGKLSIKKETIGRSLDIDINQKLIEDYVLKRVSGVIKLRVDEIIPKIRYDNIKDIKDVLASFSTVFSRSQPDRSHNIELACKKIDGTILLAGEVFSMDKTLGPRTVENGYKEAPVIQNNELIPGAGGGVCQVTTTLYGAVLRTNLDVVERKHHSMPLGYVEPGQDATISEGYIDFKFKNSRDYPICINAFVKGNRLEIRIYGKKNPDDHVVKIRSEVIEEIFPEEEEYIIDNSVPYGEVIYEREAKLGLKVIVYKEIYNKQGNLLNVEKVSEDVYMPIRAKIKVNKKYYDNIISINNRLSEVYNE